MLPRLKSVNHECFLQQTCFCAANKLFGNVSASAYTDSREHLLQKGLPKQKPIDGVKQILLVASGKGGVGKSTIAVNLAVALKNIEPHKSVGLLDADVFGPSVPLMMNLGDTPLLTDDNLLKPLVNYGVKCLSMGNLITEKSATIWRGLMVMNALDKLLRQVAWGPLDYMIIDTPPGTGDVHLSLVQNIPITGAVIVSTGQKAALQVARRGVTMFEKLRIPVVGLILNMSAFRCHNCSQHTTLFGNYMLEFSKSANIEILESIPLDQSIMEASDAGKPIIVSAPFSSQAQIFVNAATKILRFLNNESVAST